MHFDDATSRRRRLQVSRFAPEATHSDKVERALSLSQSLRVPSQDTSHCGNVASYGSEIYTGKLKIVNNTTSCMAEGAEGAAGNNC